MSVEAAKTLPDNHTIEQLEVKWLDNGSHGYSISFGDRVGTLLIRVDRPKTEWDNWLVKQPRTVNFHLQTNLESKKHQGIPPFDFTSTCERYLKDKGVVRQSELKLGILKGGLMKFSDFTNPNYYAGLVIKLDKKYNEDSVFWFGGNSYALKEEGQVKAYFYPNDELVVEAYNRIGTKGTFPLMNKVIWEKKNFGKGSLVK